MCNLETKNDGNNPSENATFTEKNAVDSTSENGKRWVQGRSIEEFLSQVGVEFLAQTDNTDVPLQADAEILAQGDIEALTAWGADNNIIIIEMTQSVEG